jgi:hypothetical protein
MPTLRELAAVAALAWVVSGTRVPAPYDYASVLALAARLYAEYTAGVDVQQAYAAAAALAVAWLYWILTNKVSGG